MITSAVSGHIQASSHEYARRRTVQDNKTHLRFSSATPRFPCDRRFQRSSAPTLPLLRSRQKSSSSRGQSTRSSPSLSISSILATEPASQVAAAEALQAWLESAGYPPLSGNLSLSSAERPQGVVLTAARKFNLGEAVFNIPENFSVTAVDVASHPVLSLAATPGSSDLALLALWLLWESSQGEESPWAPYLKTFTVPPPSPLLWTIEERNELLKGHSGLATIHQRIMEIEALYSSFSTSLFIPQPSQFPPDKFSLDRFKEAFVSVLSRAVFLPGADIFALLPLADFVRHSPTSKAFFQYNPESQSVVLTADKALQPGDEVFVSRGPELTNFDLALQTGEAADNNPFDFVAYQASLVPADPLFAIKKQLLQEEGFSQSQIFPLFADRFPRQLLSYLRLARLQDSAQFPKVTFKADMIVSESNEYEILMLVLGDCKERLIAFSQTYEDDVRQLNGKPASQGLLQSLTGGKAEGKEDAHAKAVRERKERLAARLRASEKKILNKTVTALRNRLAPIRGIPTKSGMGDPNLEIKEVFGMMEAGFTAPQRILGGLFKKDK